MVAGDSREGAWPLLRYRRYLGARAATADSRHNRTRAVYVGCAIKEGIGQIKILVVFTSHDILGSTGRKTGFWLEEGAAPYFVFRDAGVDLTLVSPKGGRPPVDPKSDLPENQTPAMARFKKDEAAQKVFATTAKMEDMRSEAFDAVFYPGGHGPMWDLVDNPQSIALIDNFEAACEHGLEGIMRNTKTPLFGQWLA